MRRNLIPFAILVSLALAACSATASSAGTTPTPEFTVPPMTSPASTTGTGGGGGQPSASTDQVEIANFAFTPATITVKVGSTITWTNRDSAPHTATASDGSFDSGSLATGATFSWTFTKVGTYPYVCTFHASMRGTVIVTP